jgi:RNA polymerase sigma factor (sigma-70 family)
VTNAVDVLGYLPLARCLARRFWRTGRRFLPEDYEQEAYLALVIAAEQFDAGRGCAFTTFAYLRIVGALQDAHRRWSDYSRTYRTTPVFISIHYVELCADAGLMSENDVERIDALFAASDDAWFSRFARLRYVDGLSAEEAATCTGASRATVEVACSQFKQHITRELAA